MTSYDRPVAALRMSPSQQQSEPLAGRTLENLGLYAYAYRLTLSDAAASAALRRAAVTVRSGRPRGLDDAGALDLMRAEVGRASVQRSGSEIERAEQAEPAIREDDLLRIGFHRRLHALPTLERQAWLLRYTGRHDIDAIASMLREPAERIRLALSAAARTLVAGELNQNEPSGNELTPGEPAASGPPPREQAE
ncbi:hypothetical protein C5E02_13540 [Rathayibacter rathayi]|uniref:hypothetical protein n=1 Tax=Rathayibacter rathayi TaxID=33887 RepID=UPI000BCB460C|nr:hypothetical protein [Rathayibacter rathayi]AZZ50136.1 hypothetical protein C1O28_13845 [Rathayibacter rathayi]MWV74579.1 hypothetical protein [Rathayibacter rathayi NCPPB 2980 = VKM Ac-1601]PPF49717.1 hypothetical protein C5C08_06605 [Rathayibacter rathayi]PPG65708.1 hypothetical protein C5C16_12590 [Rathayibacter rathayi]PPG76125.1 hypothetical protein C5C15_11665 [Rathayibacter rathayi]